MRTLLPVQLLALVALVLACAPRASSPAEARLGRYHTEPLAPEEEAQRRPGDSDYAARVRADLTARRAEVQGCFTQVGGARRPVAVMVSSPLYVSPGAAYFPRHAASSFMAAFERCLLTALERWPLPRPVSSYEGVWLRFHLRPVEEGAPVTTPQSPLFELESTRVLLELTQEDPSSFVARPEAAATAGAVRAFDADTMTPPQPLNATQVRFSEQALALRVQGIMVVNCILTVRGVVENCRIQEPLPYMERNVLTALYARRYTPVLFEGRPLKVDFTFTIHLKPYR